MTPAKFRAAAIVVSVVTVALSALGTGLPRDTFVTGDSGVKLIAARAALAHATRPLQIDWPSVAGTPQPFLEPFFAVHDEHAHAVTSELFVLISAPIIGMFGIAGAYILPLVGFVAAIAGCAWLGVSLDGRRTPALIAGVAAVGTPFIFYALEFWEHTPALGAASLGTALLVSARNHRRAALSGVLLAAAVLLRPEAAWLVVAVGAGLVILHDRPPASILGVALAAGIAAVLPMVVYAALHFGSFVTPHISGNEAILSRHWLAGRLTLATTWFVPSFQSLSASHVDFWTVAPAMALALLPVPRAQRRNGRGFLATVAIVYALLVVATAPNDGGAQWGPRYLLFAYVPAAILTGDVLSWLVSNRRTIAIAAAMLLLSVWIDRAAYRNLRTAKIIYGRIVAFVEQRSTPGEPIVTDLWWLDQVAAKLSTSRTFLYAGDPSRRAALIAAADRAKLPSMVLVTSRGESPAGADAWFAGTCYVVDTVSSITDRHLSATHVQRRCPSQ